MFDDHFVVESPGILPGLVRISNIREFHFSRNPKIVELLTEYEFVKELGEGVDRVYRDMAEAGLAEPEYRQAEFMLYAVLKNKNWGKEDSSWQSSEHQSEHQGEHDTVTGTQKKRIAFCAIPRTRLEMMDHIGMKSRSGFYRYYLKPLIESGLLVMTNQSNPRSKDQKYVAKS